MNLSLILELLSVLTLAAALWMLFVAIKKMHDKIEGLQSYQKSDHKVFINEVDSAHRRIEQLERIVFQKGPRKKRMKTKE